MNTFSKWPEAFIMTSTSSHSTVEKFRSCFAIFGLPKVVVTDNGSQLVSEEFTKFLFINGIKHLTSPPFHPATNGFAENSVKSIKNGLKKAIMDDTNSGASFETLLNRYLFHYRNSVHMTTGVTPSSLIFKHKIRTRLDLLEEKDKVSRNVINYKGKRDEKFVEGDRVWCRDYRNPNKKGWSECIIDEVLGDRVYLCKLVNEKVIWKRHMNQILRDRSGEEIKDDNCYVLKPIKVCASNYIYLFNRYCNKHYNISQTLLPRNNTSYLLGGWYAREHPSAPLFRLRMCVFLPT
ncbi:hypothetical protein NQ314_021149 [Rhamnusium bicolor]|uniref:Integrase catalytic domain-containing protein n=1 Tax=Rhamnusium bicolor TaxID=1586634 RepID=A0AAV8WJP0_9CUCU|nr:hypothetical protein NQ314_021149 [Rhamnusium bicolor]